MYQCCVASAHIELALYRHMQCLEVETRACGDAQVDVFEQVLPAVPGVQADELVGAHQPRHGGVRAVDAAQFAHGVNGVAGAVAIDFHAAHMDTGAAAASDSEEDSVKETEEELGA